MALLCHVESSSGGGTVQRNCISIALLQSTDRFTTIVTFTHSEVPAAQQEEFGVQYLARGHFDMQLGEPGI